MYILFPTVVNVAASRVYGLDPESLHYPRECTMYVIGYFILPSKEDFLNSSGSGF